MRARLAYARVRTASFGPDPTRSRTSLPIHIHRRYLEIALGGPEPQVMECNITGMCCPPAAGSDVTTQDLPAPETAHHTEQHLSLQEVRALGLIEQYCVGGDYWEDETIRKYRAAGLVRLLDNRIVVTEKGRQIAAGSVKRA